MNNWIKGDREFTLRLPAVGDGSRGTDEPNRLHLMLFYNDINRSYVISITPSRIKEDGAEVIWLTCASQQRAKLEVVPRYNAKKLDAWRQQIANDLGNCNSAVWGLVQQVLTAENLQLVPSE
jgi:hypothetical protein